MPAVTDIGAKPNTSLNMKFFVDFDAVYVSVYLRRAV